MDMLCKPALPFSAGSTQASDAAVAQEETGGWTDEVQYAYAHVWILWSEHSLKQQHVHTECPIMNCQEVRHCINVV